MVSPGTHLVKNHESQSRTTESQFKNTSPWVFCNHTVNLKTDSNTPVLKFAEMKLCSFYHQVQQRLREICVIKQQRQEQPQKSHKQDILH